MALLLFLVAGLVAQSPSARLTVEIPVALQGLSVEAAVVCRDARGTWSGVEDWGALDARLPSVLVRKGCRVLLRRTGAGVYLASPMFSDVKSDKAVAFQAPWLRTARAGPSASQPYWVGEGASAAECLRTPAASLCMFIAAEDAGALVTLDESGLWFALSPANASGSVAAWRAAPWGRLVRVRAPAERDWHARVSVLEPALRHGRDLLQRPRESSAGVLHRVGERGLWVEGGEPEPGARLEISGPGAATLYLELSRVRGSPLTILNIPLVPEEVIEGEVRSEGRLLAGATVSLMRYLAPPSRDRDRGDDRPAEAAGESSTGPTGRFRFDRLGAGDYELTVAHPRRGRARLDVRAPSHHRVVLKPQSLIRGRVTAGGVPVADATITVLPSYDAVVAARNPAMLIGESVQTAIDGRFELAAPDEGLLTLTVLSKGAAARIDLGDAQALSAIVDLGDVKLAEPLDVVILLELPSSCVVSAAGPVGQPGVLLHRAEPVGPGRWLLKSALEGRWLVEASCGGADVPLDIALIEVNRRNRELVRLTPRREPASLR